MSHLVPTDQDKNFISPGPGEAKPPEEGGKMISCLCLWLHRFLGSGVAPPASLSSVGGSDAGGVSQALVLKITHAWVFWIHPLVLLTSPVSGSA